MTDNADRHSSNGSEHWARMKESGTVAGLEFLFAVYRLFGRQVFRFMLVFVSFYFLCVRGAQRRASQDYLATHARFYPSDWRGKPGLRHSFYHFFEFGESILDKLLAWNQDVEESEFIVREKRKVRNILDDKRGQLIIGTHFGNLEYCRGFMQQNKNKQINILIHDRHSANFVRAMERYGPESRLNVYQVDEMDMSMILTLKNKVDRGEWLFIAGDRQPLDGVQRTVAVSFLGRPAAFPEGPYQLARTLGCPVSLMFAYRKKEKVVFDLVPFADKIEFSNHNRNGIISHYARQLAFELEKKCKEVPFQWFNFFDFWVSPGLFPARSSHQADVGQATKVGALGKQSSTEANTVRKPHSEAVGSK